MKEKYYSQVCQDNELTKDFRQLHTDLVNKVIEFCKNHNIEIDEFYLHADGLRESIKYGSWQACTDSGFEMHKDEYKDRPFLFSM